VVIFVSVAEGVFGSSEKLFSCHAPRADRLNLSPLHRKEWKSVPVWFISYVNRQIMIIPTTYANQSCCGPHSRRLFPTNLYRLPLSLLSETSCGFFGTAGISFNFKMSETHGLCSFLPTAPLCSRDSDGCDLERTATKWLGVRPDYPQVRFGNVLRWMAI
jgi:hypothetical protein